MIDFDLNYSEFQRDLLGLEKEDAFTLLNTLRKVRQMTWGQVYRDKGLNWETIHSRGGPNGQRLYSVRISKKIRAVVYREGDMMVLLLLHPDHDSAYKK